MPARTDVAVRLRERVGPYANVAAPADLVALPADRAAELVAAVAEFLDTEVRDTARALGEKPQSARGRDDEPTPRKVTST